MVGLRDVAGRRAGLAHRVEHRLRLLVLAEVAGLPARAEPVHGVAARARTVPRDARRPCSFSFDIDLLEKYWVERPMTYHHTMPILQYYALYEGIRLALEEGLEKRWARHEDAGRYFQQQMRDRGYTFLSDPDHQLWELSRDRRARGRGRQGGPDAGSCASFNIEVGGGLGPTAPPIWRVGLMGVNANRETADRVLAAFDEVLPRVGDHMTRKDRLHRSELAVPGTNVRAMEKAATLGADVVFLDLEDAVAPDDKERARGERHRGAGRPRLDATRPSACASTGSTPTGATATSSTWWRRAARCSTPCWCRRWARPSDVEFVATLLDQIEQRNGWEPGRIGIHILIETAAGMANVEAISRARPDRLEAMVFGVADYAASVRARTTNIGGANPDYTVLTDPDEPACARDALGRPVALRDQPDGGGVPRRGPAPDRRPVRRLQRRGRVPQRRPTAPRPSGARASGRSTRRRSRWRTRSSRPPRPRSTARGGSCRRWRTRRRRARAPSRSTAGSSTPRPSAWPRI